jgi:hypothetical protein
MNRRILILATLSTIQIVACEEDKNVGKDKYPTVEEAQLKGVARTNLDSPDPTEAQLARKRENIKHIKSIGLPSIDHLPVVEDEKQIKPRTAQEVAERSIATVICCVKGETQGKDKALIDELVQDFGASGYFSPKEAAFIKNPNPGRQELIDFAWRYECLHVFLWALGLNETLKPPNAICDVKHDVGLIRKLGPKDFIAKAKLRPMSEILDMADLYYRLHWAAIELRLKSQKSDKLDEGIIRERHRALNWLIRYMNQSWDDVTTDT